MIMLNLQTKNHGNANAAHGVKIDNYLIFK